MAVQENTHCEEQEKQMGHGIKNQIMDPLKPDSSYMDLNSAGSLGRSESEQVKTFPSNPNSWMAL